MAPTCSVPISCSSSPGTPVAVFLAGALKINNVLTLRYTSPYTRPLTTFPPIFQGTITLDLKRVGANSIPFDYQAANVLQPIAQCSL